MDPQATQTSQASAPTATPKEKTSIGPLVGSLIVLVVLVVGGLYLWGGTINQEQVPPPFILGDENADAGLPPTSNSDTVVDIESDISSTDLSMLEAEIEADMQAAQSAL